jgi:hypothetical protein
VFALDVLMAALLLSLPGLPECAQPSTAEFLPELDACVRLNSNVRFAFQAKETLKEGDLTRIEQMLEDGLYSKFHNLLPWQFVLHFRAPSRWPAGQYSGEPLVV